LPKNVRPVVVVAGTGSNVGKTTLMCRLLQHLDAWDAIKVTRGHYRSCGRDPDTCCVSNLLGDAPKLISERSLTDVPNKDTGRYWQAGAANVHWLVATSIQIEAGIHRALELASGRGVLIEGTSILRYIKPELTILVSLTNGNDEARLKPTARRALIDGRVDAIYTSDDSQRFPVQPEGPAIESIPVYGPSTFPDLLNLVRTLK